ncbi:MAG: BON domain-containing protein [Deltaproteobacteria bacterium]
MLEAEVAVAVDRGVVILSGRVTSGENRQAAQDAAHRVSGVLDVAPENAIREMLP